MRPQTTSGVIEIRKRLVIAVTGTPGTGKSHFATKLSKFLGGVGVIEINDIVEKGRLFTGSDANGAKIVEMKELRKALQAKLKKNKGPIILVGHLAADLDLHYNICIVTRSGLSRLSKIFKDRRYNKSKTRENLFAEALDYCGIRAEDKADEIYEVETRKQKDGLMLYMRHRIDGKKTKKPRIARISKMGELRSGMMNGKIKL